MNKVIRKTKAARSKYGHTNAVEACLAEIDKICRQEADVRRRIKRELTNTLKSFPPHRLP